MTLRKFSLIFLMTLFFLSDVHKIYSWESKIVYYGAYGKLVYIKDEQGNRIPDFSHAGYKGGGIPIPDIPVVKTISPIEGDNTMHIQNALFEIGMQPKDVNGFRGTLLLQAGVYEIFGTINIGIDGVVLRGVGDGDDLASNTILKAVGDSPHQRTVVIAGGGGSTKWQDREEGTTTNIISDSVMVGSCAFEVEDATPFSVGDNIIIYHPCTAEWLAAVDSGGTHWYMPAAEPGKDLPWSVGSLPIVFNRYITDIQKNTITVDVPVFNHLIRSLSQSYIYKYARIGLRKQIGIENLGIDIEAQHIADEDHAWNGIDLYQIEDSWVKDCTILNFGLSGIRTNTASRITVENCQALDPAARVEGGKRYNFNIYTASQQILFKNCHASNGRHHYISNGKSWTSGCVFLDCTSQGAYTSSEGHRRWSVGLLFDNLVELDGPRPGYNPRLLGLYNRGYYGTSHGWAAAHSVAWNCDVANGDLIVQKPPTAQNYAIGCFGGRITGNKPPAPFDESEGYIEGSGEAGLYPRSLYKAQLEERLTTSVNDDKNLTNKDNQQNVFTLYRNYPNPFNTATMIHYHLQTQSNVILSIYNVLGQKVRSLINEYQTAGDYLIRWDGKNEWGDKMPTGIYIYQIICDGVKIQKKMLLHYSRLH